MKKKLQTFIAMLLAFCMFAGCSSGITGQIDHASPQRHWEEVSQMRQNSTAENDENYSGLLSGLRTGVIRKCGSLTSGQYDCTDKGVYFMCPTLMAESNSGVEISSSYLFFLDHTSDTMIKLCGRPDCTHDTEDCNAVFLNSFTGISYFDGKLYAAKEIPGGPEMYILYRMDPDGTNRVKVLDCSSVNQGQYTSFGVPQVQHGVFMFYVGYIGDSGEPIYDWYYYKLDGSMDDIEKMISGYCWNDGEAFLHGSPVYATNGEEIGWDLVQWDPDTNTETVIASISDMDLYIGTMKASYWGINNGLAHYNGQVLKINYPHGDTEVLFETGIRDGHTTRFFPDCLAVQISGNVEKGENDWVRIYSYCGELLGEVEIDVPTNSRGTLLQGECRDRIFLGTSIASMLPTYYIDKSEFGSGKLELHVLEYPDISEDDRNLIFSAETKTAE